MYKNVPKNIKCTQYAHAKFINDINHLFFFHGEHQKPKFAHSVKTPNKLPKTKTTDASTPLEFCTSLLQASSSRTD